MFVLPICLVLPFSTDRMSEQTLQVENTKVMFAWMAKLTNRKYISFKGKEIIFSLRPPAPYLHSNFPLLLIPLKKTCFSLF